MDNMCLCVCACLCPTLYLDSNQYLTVYMGAFRPRKLCVWLCVCV